jgi:hypothetical protein
VTCVVIETDEAGKVMVGALPQDQKPDYGNLLQPAGSVDEALAKAKELLGGQPEQEGQAEAQFKQGFANRQPAGPMSPGGM